MIYRILLLGLFLPSLSFASDDLTLSGFGTLGVVASDSKNYGYRSNIHADNGAFSSELDFKSLSLLGVQAKYKLTDKIDFVGQAIVRDLVDPTFSDYISQAFLGYTPNANWDFRAGRLSLDLFLLSEYRNISFAYPWTTVPNEVYGIIPYQYFDGLDISHTIKLDEGTARIKLFAGQSESKVSSVALNEQIISDDIKLRDMLGINLTYDKTDWVVQARFSSASVVAKPLGPELLKQQIQQLPDFIWPIKDETFQQLDLHYQRVNYISLGGQRFWHQWNGQFEYAQVLSDSEIIRDLKSGYIALEYQSDKHSFFGYGAITKSDHFVFNNPQVNQALVPELVGGLSSILNFYASNQQSLAVGWRWDFLPKYSLKAQYTRTKIDEKGATLWLNHSLNSPSETVNVLSLSLSFTL